MNSAFTSIDTLNAGTKGLVFIGDKLIVYRRDYNTDVFPGYLDLPGGGAEVGETPFQTFKRELREEFGLELTESNIVYTRQYQSSLHASKTVWFVVAQFPAAAGRQIVFGNEGTDYMLMSASDYIARDDAWPEFQDRARQYLETLNKQMLQ